MSNSKLSSQSKFDSPTRRCDGLILKRLFQSGLVWFERYHDEVNRLNVFPVPDGDTGTNMLLTLKSAYARIAANDSANAGELLDQLAIGAENGSRGNSGTLLSQLLRGFANEIGHKPDFDAAQLVAGFHAAVKLAYKALQMPVEGTILTVAREMAEEAEAQVTRLALESRPADLKLIMQHVIERGAQAVARTPELLPILKQAGVVDSGGRGLLLFFEGMLHKMGSDEAIKLMMTAPPAQSGQRTVPALHHLENALTAPDSRGYGYDVQYMVRGPALNLEAIRTAIGQMGDSMIVVGDSKLVKVHIHVHDPGEPLSYGVKLGVITDVVVENMQAQSEAYLVRRQSEALELGITVNAGDIAVVAVVPGAGLRKVFRQLGAVGIVSGGQTMNPSAEEILQVIQTLNSDKIILLPNNKNVELTAELVARLARERSGPHVSVIPTQSIPQGVAAMLSFAASGDFEQVAATMRSAATDVRSAEITTATRSADFDGLKVEAGKLIGLIDGKLAVVGDDLPTLVRDLLREMGAQEHEIVTLYYGEPVREVEATALIEALRADFPDQEFELVEGGQPFYHYLLSVE